MKRISDFYDIEDAAAVEKDPKSQRTHPGGACAAKKVFGRPSPTAGGVAGGISDKPKTTRECEIISCSRRTDVPAFFMPWALDAIRAGYVDVTNPHNPKQVSRVSLDPRVVRCFAWWSKDYANWLAAWRSPAEDSDSAALLHRYDSHYFNFTINTPCSDLEPGVRTSLEGRLQQMSELAAEFGPQSVVLRFDPVVHWKSLRSDNPWVVKNNLGAFDQICGAAKACGIVELTTAFAIGYPAVRARMRRRDLELVDLDPKAKVKVAKEMTEIASSHGVRILVCSQPELLEPVDLGGAGFCQGCCINGNNISKMLIERGKPGLSRIGLKKDGGQRTTCYCSKSIDIAGYGQKFACGHSCAYCYANPAPVPANS